jgi:hypothetical protein
MALRAAAIVVILVAAATASAQRAPSAETIAAIRSQMDGGVDGRLGERIPGNYVFRPLRPEWPQLPIVNPEKIGPLALGPVVRVRGRVDDGGRVTVDSVALPRRPLTPAVKSITDPLVQFMEMSISTPATKANPEPRSLEIPKDKEEARLAIKRILDGYKAALSDDQQRRELVAEWDELRSVFVDIYRDSQEAKAIYGSLDNYHHWRYQAIYGQAPSVVAIGEPNNPTSVCSGVIIATDLVLTAAHCFTGEPPRDPLKMEVWLGYVNTGAVGQTASFTRRKITGLVSPTLLELQAVKAGKPAPNALDYVVLRIAPAAAGQPPTPPELCLRPHDMARGDAVYVIGYPQGQPVMVHDSAHVYLPHRIEDGDPFVRLRLNVEADVRLFRDGANLMTQFVQSYQLVTVGNVPTRELRHVRDNGEPRMGIVADTFEGNSGGPVFDHERGQCVVGILVAGSDDSGLRRRPNWKEHERVLPITVILEDLNRRKLTNLGLKLEQ